MKLLLLYLYGKYRVASSTLGCGKQPRMEALSKLHNKS